MFIRLPAVFVCSLGWLQPTLGKDNFCLVDTCMKHKKHTKKLQEKVSNQQSQLNMLKKNFNELKKLLIVEVDIRKLSHNVGKLNDDIEEIRTDVGVLSDMVGEVETGMGELGRDLFQHVGGLNDERLGDIEEIRTDVAVLNGRVGKICEWGDGEGGYADRCFKLRIWKFEIAASYDPKNTSYSLSTRISGEEVSSVRHDTNAGKNFFTFYTGSPSKGVQEKRQFHLNPDDANVNIYGFPPGDSTNDKIDRLEDMTNGLCVGYDGQMCDGIQARNAIRVGDHSYYSKESCLYLQYQRTPVSEQCLA